MLRGLLLSTISIGVPLLVSSQEPQTGSGETRNVPIIRRATRVVNVDVVVTDGKGQPVQGLGKEDFQILDNGQPEQIAFFSTRRHTVAPTIGIHALIPGDIATILRGQA